MPGHNSAPDLKTVRCVMPPRRNLIRVSVTLPSADFLVYASAAQILARITGVQAPAANVIAAQFSGRSPSDIACDYLDSVGWPLEGRKRSGRTD